MEGIFFNLVEFAKLIAQLSDAQHVFSQISAKSACLATPLTLPPEAVIKALPPLPPALLLNV
jgi:hypothetical protein